jgi:hypothetical protein
MQAAGPPPSPRETKPGRASLTLGYFDIVGTDLFILKV